MGRRFILPDQDATSPQMPVNLELEQLRGRFGQALSDLRPAGVVDFDGRRVDVITEGMMVPAGAWVRCVDVKAGRVVVRPVDQPDLDDLESADFILTELPSETLRERALLAAQRGSDHARQHPRPRRRQADRGAWWTRPERG